MRHPAVFLGLLTSLAVGVVSLSASTARADTTLSAQADTFVRGGTSADANFGADDNLLVKFGVGTNGVNVHRKSYVRFDLSPLSGVVTQATLSLTISDAIIGNITDTTQEYTFHLYGLIDGVGENWTEGDGTLSSPSTTGITWNNAPANDTTSGFGVTSDALSLATFTLVGRGTAGQVINISNPTLLSFLNADTDNQVTFILARDTLEISDDNQNSVIHAFASKERGGPFAPPTLTVLTSNEAPEPTSLALLMLAGIPLLRRRRRL